MTYITIPIEEYESLKDSILLKKRIEELTVENNSLRQDLFDTNSILNEEKEKRKKYENECKVLSLGTEIFKEYEFMFKKGNFFKKLKVLFL